MRMHAMPVKFGFALLLLVPFACIATVKEAKADAAFPMPNSRGPGDDRADPGVPLKMAQRFFQ